MLVEFTLLKCCFSRFICVCGFCLCVKCPFVVLFVLVDVAFFLKCCVCVSCVVVDVVFGLSVFDAFLFVESALFRNFVFRFV